VGAPDLVLAQRYRLIQPVAHRARTTLWRGVDEVLARPVAVKVLDDPAAGPGGAEGFVAAAAAAGRLAHPRIASIYDAAIEDGLAYVVSEWVEGAALADILKDGPLRPQRATTVVAQVAEAVSAAHARGMHHLDLDGHNVLLCADGGLKVTDFALGAATAGVDDVADPVRTDTLALGALLYTALTARSATGAESALPAAPRRDGRLLAPRLVRAGVPRELDLICQQILTPDTVRGGTPLRTPADVLRALAVLPGEGGEVIEDAVLPATERPPRRLIRLGVPIAVVLTVGLAALAIGRAIGGTPTNKRRAVALPTVSASAGASARTPIRPAAVTDFDPEGDGEENHAAVPLAYDGDGSTAWETTIYRNQPTFGNLKPGAGLLVDLGSPREVQRLDLALSKPGVSLELRAADTLAETYDAYRVVGTTTATKVTATITPPAGTKARYWLIWVTKLVPIAGEKDRFRAGIAEFAFS
jgi:hypothetical protein